MSTQLLREIQENLQRIKISRHTHAPRPRIRVPLSAIGKITLVTMLGVVLAAACIGKIMFSVSGHIDPMVVAFMAVPLVMAGLIATGWRWTPLLGTLAGGLLLAALAPHLPSVMAIPSDPMFAPFVVLLALAAVGVPAGIGATVQNYRRAAWERRAPRWLAGALAGVAGTVAGVLLMAALAPVGSASGISPEALSELPALTTENFVFDQAEIRVTAGELVMLRLENADPVTHSFDVDELDVHVVMPHGQTALAVFKPTEPGSYTFYCAPHYDKKTGHGMKGTLIVES
ncbi:hypothetical protein BH24GEM3_BH24GEM3_15460 [soil metagenome]